MEVERPDVRLVLLLISTEHVEERVLAVLEGVEVVGVRRGHHRRPRTRLPCRRRDDVPGAAPARWCGGDDAHHFYAIEATPEDGSAPPTLRDERSHARRRERQKGLASFLAPAYSSRQTRFLTTGSGMRARTRRSCTVMRRDPIIFALDIFTFRSPFASAHFTFCTIESHRTLT